VLRNTIREVVVIQEAERFGISVSESEVAQIMYSYQLMFPEIFEDALDTYGYDGLVFGLRQRRLYNLVRDFIIYNEVLPGIEISDSILIEHLDNIEAIDVELNDESRHYIKNHYIDHFVIVNFEKIREQLYQNADIIYFINLEWS